jgi:superfamily II DNA or RNA helicase
MNITMSPDEAKATLGKFADLPWREHQMEAVNFVMQSDKKFKVIEAPTGSGKTLIGMTCGVMAGEVIP